LNILYRLLAVLFPTRKSRPAPRRILLVLPCCIGDVILATATLCALRRAFSQAHITWAVGSWSRGALEGHPLLDALLDTGVEALPVKSFSGFWRFVRQVRAGRYDLVVSLVRSPLMSAALWFTAIPFRTGLNSSGRGFGYNIRVEVDARTPRHEADIYLDTARALHINTAGCRANVAVFDEIRRHIQDLLGNAPYLVLNPAGGRNPGMVMDSKRYPPDNFARLGDKLAARTGARVVLIGGPDDDALVEAVRTQMYTAAQVLTGLSFKEIAALAAEAMVYIGNDTGLTHLAAAAGAKTVMIMGPSDPARYAPYTDNAIAVWKPANISPEGVAAGAPADWDWARDGISVEEVEQRIIEFLGI
jgi:ADP-heptose:LPS heptosyltransferase